MKKTNTYTFLLFSLILFNSYQIPKVKGQINDTFLYYEEFTSVIGNGYCYFGWDGLVCDYSDWLNTTFPVSFTTPPTIDGNLVTSYTLQAINVLSFEMEDSSIITNAYIDLYNFTDWDELSTLEDPFPYYRFDRQIFSAFPPIAYNEQIYNLSTGLTDYVRIMNIQDINPIEYGDIETNQMVYYSQIRLNMNASEVYNWEYTISLVYIVDVVYYGGGWDEFTNAMILFLPQISFYLLLIYVFGKRYGYMGGGLAMVLGATIFYMVGLNENVYTFTLIFLGLAFLFFSQEYKKRKGMVEI